MQLDLLSTAVDVHNERLMEVIDLLNSRYGSGTIRFASEGMRQEWKMRSDLRSPRYTTRWDELLVVKAKLRLNLTLISSNFAPTAPSLLNFVRSIAHGKV